MKARTNCAASSLQVTPILPARRCLPYVELVLLFVDAKVSYHNTAIPCHIKSSYTMPVTDDGAAEDSPPTAEIRVRESVIQFHGTIRTQTVPHIYIIIQ